jgi:hypothetical protein
VNVPVALIDFGARHGDGTPVFEFVLGKITLALIPVAGARRLAKVGRELIGVVPRTPRLPGVRIDPQGGHGRSWVPPVLAGVCLVVLAAFDRSGIGPTPRLNLYVVPVLAAALGVLALAAEWADRARRAVPDTLGPALLSFLAGVAGLARGDVLGSATGTWLCTETASLFALLVVVAWSAPVRRAVPTAVLVVAAAALMPARFEPRAAGATLVAASALSAAGAVAAAGLGTWLRTRDTRRTRPAPQPDHP